MHRRVVDLDDRVELNRVKASRPAPVDDVLAERPPHALAPASRVYHEGGGAYVGTARGPVRAHLGRADDPALVAGDDGAPRRLLHPPRLGLIEALPLGEGIRPALGHDLCVEGVDARPILVGGYANFHAGQPTWPPRPLVFPVRTGRARQSHQAAAADPPLASVSLSMSRRAPGCRASR